MRGTGNRMAQAQQKYKDNFDKRVQSSRGIIKHESFLFLEKKFYGSHEQKYMLYLATKGPLRVLSTTDTTVVVQIDEKQERFSRDRVVATQTMDKLMRKEAIHDEENKAQHERVGGKRCTSVMRYLRKRPVVEGPPPAKRVGPNHSGIARG